MSAKLSQQDIYNIKQDYLSGYGVRFIANDRGFTVEQVMFAINVDEDHKIDFEKHINWN